MLEGTLYFMIKLEHLHRFLLNSLKYRENESVALFIKNYMQFGIIILNININLK